MCAKKCGFAYKLIFFLSDLDEDAHIQVFIFHPELKCSSKNCTFSPVFATLRF